MCPTRIGLGFLKNYKRWAEYIIEASAPLLLSQSHILHNLENCFTDREKTSADQLELLLEKCTGIEIGHFWGSLKLATSRIQENYLFSNLIMLSLDFAMLG